MKATFDRPSAGLARRNALPAPPRDRRAEVRTAAVLFLLPTIALLSVLMAYPIVKVLWSSVFYVDLLNPTTSGFAGFENYLAVFDDGDFLPALQRTLTWTLLSVAGEYVLGLVSAVALAQPIRGRAVFRGIILVPWLIPIAVAGLNWTWMLTPDYGIINLWLVKAGLLDAPYYWLGQPDTSLLTITVVNIWRSFPFYTLSLLAALMAVPREIHEAAAVDGAGAWRRFFVITMPHLKTVSLTLVFIHVVWTAINFDFIWVMTEGGPINSSETLPIMIYRYAMQTYDVGAASAIATMMMGFLVSAFTIYYYAALRARREP